MRLPPALLLLFSWPLFVAPSLRQSARGKEHTIDTLMQRLHKRGQFDGSIIVAQSGKIVYRNALGEANESTRQPFRPTTISNIGSLAKQFTAMAIMLLCERRAIAYDDPISTVLPELRRYAHGVTIRHLLNHTSGIPDVGDLNIDRPGLTNAEVLQALTEQDSLASRPGTTYRYSNTGYVLLAGIIERVTGERFGAFLSREILQPLGMNSTYVHRGSIPAGREVAMAYDEFGRPSDYTGLTTGDGGIFSSVDDLLKWDQALYAGAILPAATFASAMEPPLLDAGKSTYAFGWNVREERGGRVFWHSGRTGGYRAFIERRPFDQLSIMMLTNHGNTNRTAIVRAIVNIMHDQPYELPKRSIAATMFAAIPKRGIEGALRLYDSLSIADSSSYDFSEGELNGLGYALLNDSRTSAAVRVFLRNATSFPKSSNAFDSLGEAYVKSGDSTRAISAYKKALQLDPSNLSAAEMLQRLGARTQ